MLTQKCLNIIRDRAVLAKPSERLTVPEAAAKYLRLNTGPWKNELTHYMVEPGECLTSRVQDGVVFAGPARTGKTQMLCDNWAVHSVMCDPTNHMLVFPIDDLVGVYSRTRIDPMHRHSPKIRAELGTGRSDDNVGLKQYRSGMNLTFVSPTKNTLAMKDLARVGLSDYDRYDDDIGGDGPAWTLGHKRTETFLSRGMTMAESSPSKPITDSQWRLTSTHPHEAPPTNGILGLYNDGDRRRLYGKCQNCGEFFMPTFGIDAVFVPSVDDVPDIDDRVAQSGLICTVNGCINTHDHEREWKKSAVWVKEGQTITSDGVIHGDGRKAKIASFWMHGWNAAFNKWGAIIYDYLRAEERFDRSQDELALKGVVNVDMGGPYLEKSRQSDRTADSLRKRAELLDKRVVPVGVRYLLTTIDLQKYSFVVQVMGFGVDGEAWVVDRYSISVSQRTDEDGEPIVIEPATYVEDWDVLFDRVVNAKYKVDNTREMAIKAVGIDMHGVDGATQNAYAFWRKCRKAGMGAKVRLVRGGSVKRAKRVQESTPDQMKPGTNKKVKGDIPILTINTDSMKDTISAMLDRTSAGAGYVHFPDWLPDSFYEELVAETRSDKGWKKDHDNVRNESLDLFVYALALNVYLKVDTINWESPPSWACDWDKNVNILTANQKPKRKTFRRTRVRTLDDPYLN